MSEDLTMVKLKLENDYLRLIIAETIEQLEREEQSPFMYGHRVFALKKRLIESLEVIPKLLDADKEIREFLDRNKIEGK